MDLRALRKDIQNLPRIPDHIEQFQENWIKPLRTNTNRRLPFLHRLSPAAKKELNQKVIECYGSLAVLRREENIQEKLRIYAHCLVDLKLASLRGDPEKAAMLTNRLLKDEFLSMSQTLTEIQELDKTVHLVEEQYDEINKLLEKHLSLEETIFFMDLPHKIYLYALLKTAREHQRIARDLGRHFVEMARSTPNGRRR